MINTEQQHHMNYYKFVNMFTDVKQLEESSKEKLFRSVIVETET